jgi:hypothetical protein
MSIGYETSGPPVVADTAPARIDSSARSPGVESLKSSELANVRNWERVAAGSARKKPRVTCSAWT